MITMNRDERRVMEKYAYCLCLHVRPGTIFIGVINLVRIYFLLLMAMLIDVNSCIQQAGSLLCACLFLGDLIFSHQSPLMGSGTADDPMPSGRINPNAIAYGQRSTATSLAVIMYMMCATVAGMLLFGVVKSRPSYLMPFFWIQLCDFFFSLPSFLSSLYATPMHHSPYSGGSWSTATNQLKFGSSHHTSSLLIATCIILFKGYFLCVVWKCYRYLKMKEMILPLHVSGLTASGFHSFPGHHGLHAASTEIVIPPGFTIPSAAITSGGTLAPPDYETATKSNSGAVAPPDYETALKAQSPAPASCVKTGDNQGPDAVVGDQQLQSVSVGQNSEQQTTAPDGQQSSSQANDASGRNEPQNQ